MNEELYDELLAGYKKVILLLGDKSISYYAEEKSKIVATLINFVQHCINIKENRLLRRFNSLQKLRKESKGNESNYEKLIEQWIKNNIDLFYDFIAWVSLEKTNFKNRNSELFYFKLKSRYSNKKIPVLYIQRNYNKIDVLDKNNKSHEYEIKEFIKDFFGYALLGENENIREKIIKIEEFINNLSLKHEVKQSEINRLCDELSAMSNACYSMAEGAVTFCDFLGWKGLWREKGEHLQRANELISQIDKELLASTADRIPLTELFPISRLLSISDTIAIMTPKISNLSELDLINLHAELCKYILEKSVGDGFPIRGAITFGEYNFSENIMIGPAIDEAASWHEQGDWIGVIIAPSAQFIISSLSVPNDDIPHINCNDKIPLKTKLNIKYCVKWNDNGKLVALAKRTKSLTPEIAAKYINTYDFLTKINSGGGK